MSRTWYGMPACATPGKSWQVICFFQGAAITKTRYSVIGFSDRASLDHGSMWRTSFAVLRRNPTVDKTIRALVKKATA